MDGLIKSVEDVNKKLPALPPKVVDVIVMIAPWAALILGVLGVLGALTGLSALVGLSFIALPMMGTYGAVALGPLAMVSLVLVAVSSVLELMAFPGLKKEKYVGWKWLFYSTLVGVLSTAVSIVMNVSNGGFPLWGIIWTLVGFYFLFQIKPRYKL